MRLASLRKGNCSASTPMGQRSLLTLEKRNSHVEIIYSSRVTLAKHGKSGCVQLAARLGWIGLTPFPTIANRPLHAEARGSHTSNWICVLN
mgnify:CR=1 FL=1